MPEVVAFVLTSPSVRQPWLKSNRTDPVGNKDSDEFCAMSGRFGIDACHNDMRSDRLFSEEVSWLGSSIGITVTPVDKNRLAAGIDPIDRIFPT